MIYVNLTLITADGIDAEEVELLRFDEDHVIEWLNDNVWNVDCEYDVSEWQDNHHKFIKVSSDEEGVFVFAHKAH